jgi:hypothetical protein
VFHEATEYDGEYGEQYGLVAPDMALWEDNVSTGSASSEEEEQEESEEGSVTFSELMRSMNIPTLGPRTPSETTTSSEASLDSVDEYEPVYRIFCDPLGEFGQVCFFETHGGGPCGGFAVTTTGQILRYNSTFSTGVTVENVAEGNLLAIRYFGNREPTWHVRLGTELTVNEGNGVLQALEHLAAIISSDEDEDEDEDVAATDASTESSSASSIILMEHVLDTCVLCQQDMVPGDTVLMWACGHSVHSVGEHAEQWRKRCMMCRQPSRAIEQS